MKVYNLPFDLIEGGPANDHDVIIRSYRSEYDTIKNKIILHQHMINLLISGKKTIIYPDATTTVNVKEFLMLSSGNCLTSEVLSEGDAFTSVILYFDTATLNDFLVKYPYTKSKRQSSQEKKSFLLYKQDAFIQSYVNSLSVMLQLGNEFTSELKRVKLEELLLYLFQKDADKLMSLFVDSSDDADLQLRKAVESNIGNNVTVEELAFLCNCSESTFKRRFQKMYNTSPQRWLLEQKIILASNLLKHPNETPGQVFIKVGYENHSSFSRAFKQHFGVTPTEYQERHLTVQP